MSQPFPDENPHAGMELKNETSSSALPAPWLSRSSILRNSAKRNRSLVASAHAYAHLNLRALGNQCCFSMDLAHIFRVCRSEQ
jgi:hypothetical protein